ncbi:MAG: hypothetical protein K9N55_09790 [Phycisphaerae bacterium]|nr:hypothetical protein [Phycisphaerae bacterium]
MALRRWQKFFEQATLAFAGACSGVVLYLALFPGFYYMDWIFFGFMLWGTVAAATLCEVLALWIMARWKRVKLSSLPSRSPHFIVGMLVLVSLLVGFKVPLYASFLLARPELEEAIGTYSDDLDQIGRSYYRFGIYAIRGADRGCHKKDRVYFRFRNDGEAAIIYSESGIDDLCYNSGNKGHLVGNWHWMKED